MACQLWRLASTGSLLTAGSGSSISAVLARSGSAIREVVIEICGTTCVSHFTDSLRKDIVQQMDGVEGCSFADLPESENEATEFNADAKSDGFALGGKVRLRFQMQAEIDDRWLTKRLAESPFYETSSLVRVRRSKLSDLKIP